MQETQDRTRKRIKEDLKDSSATYNSYAEKTLPRLKRTYLKKCQEAEVRLQHLLLWLIRMKSVAGLGTLHALGKHHRIPAPLSR